MSQKLQAWSQNNYRKVFETKKSSNGIKYLVGSEFLPETKKTEITKINRETVPSSLRGGCQHPGPVSILWFLLRVTWVHKKIWIKIM